MKVSKFVILILLILNLAFGEVVLAAEIPENLKFGSEGVVRTFDPQTGLTTVVKKSSENNENKEDAHLDTSCADTTGNILVKFKSNNNLALTNKTVKNSKTKLSSSSNIAEIDVETFLKNKFKKSKAIKAKKLFEEDSITTNAKNRISNARISKLKALKTSHGVDRIFKINASNTSCAQKLSMLRRLNADRNVEYAEFDQIVKANFAVNDTYYQSTGQYWGLPYDELWGLKQIEADKAWDITLGQGVVVAVIDTGVDYNHPDLWNNIWVNPSVVNDRNGDGKINLNDVDLNANKVIETTEIIPEMFGKDFVTNDSDPQDGHGHGTHVAGTIAADTNNAIGLAGIAPQAKILPLKILNDYGSGSLSSAAQALLYLMDLYATNPNITSVVTNNSYGAAGVVSETLEEVFQLAQETGIISVAAAGNSNTDAKDFIPASYDSLISVAATGYNKARAGFSNYGAVVDVAAPGGGDNSNSRQSNILSTISLNSTLMSSNPGLKIQSINNSAYGYARLAGTSMASPHVAGVIALIKSKHPGFDFDDIKSIFNSTSDPITNLNQAFPLGSGIVNAFKAVSLDYPPPIIILDQSPFPAGIDGFFNISGVINVNPLGQSIREVTLEYSLQDSATNWISIPVSLTGNNFSATLNTVLLNQEGKKIFFRLKVTDLNNYSSKVEFNSVIKNVDILNMQSGDMYNSYDPIVLQAKVSNQAISANLLYKVAGTSQWLSTAVTKNNNPSSIDFATIDVTQLALDQVYDLKLSLEFPENKIIDSKILKFYVDSQLKKGFPVYVEKVYNDNINDLTTQSNKKILTADINGDGKKEIISINILDRTFGDAGHSKLEVFDYQGKKLWSIDGAAYDTFSQPISLDIDKDGKEEIFVIASTMFSSGNQAYVFGFNERGGNLPGWPKPFIQPWRMMAADVDGDSYPEILVADSDRIKDERNIVIVDPKTGLTKSSFRLDNRDAGVNIGLANLDDDQALELIFKSGSFPYYTLGALNLNDGSRVASWNPTIFPENFVPSNTWPVSGDIDNDGYDEIIVTAETVISRTTGSMILGDKKTFILDRFGALKSGLNLDVKTVGVADAIIYYSIANIDEDANKEIVFVDHDLLWQNLKIIDYISPGNTTLSSSPIHLGDQYTTYDHSMTTTITDINDDGKQDFLVAFGLNNSQLFGNNNLSETAGVLALDKNANLIDLSPNRLDSFSLVVESGSGFQNIGNKSFPLITDLDLNGKTDIIIQKEFELDTERLQQITSYDKAYQFFKPRIAIYAWELGTEYDPKKAPWSTHLHDNQATNRYTETQPNTNDVSAFGTNSSPTTFTTNTWHYTTQVVSPNLETLFVDGENKGSNLYSGVLKNYGTSPFKFGACQTLGADWDWVLNGKLDEIRIAKTNRSALWIKTEYTNQNSPQAFYYVQPIPSVWSTPVISWSYPIDNTTGIAVNTNLLIAFDREMNVQSGNITIRKSSDNSLIETIPVTSNLIFGDGTEQITIDPVTSLAGNTSYYIQIDEGAFVDSDGNNFAGILDTTTWNFTTKEIPSDWLGADWGWRVKVSVNASQVDGSVSDFPVYVNLNHLPANFFDYVAANGADVRVTKADGITQVAREVVFLDKTSKTGELHFLANLNNITDENYYIYYGNNSATEPIASSTYGKNNVWINNYAGVWHMQEAVNNSSQGYKDSTSNSNHANGVSMDLAAITGKLSGKAQDFDGTADYIIVPNSASLENVTESSFTLSAWHYPDEKPLNDPWYNSFDALVCKPGQHTGMFYDRDGHYQATIWANDSSYDVNTGATNYAINNWHHTTHVVNMISANGTTATMENLFVDGQNKGSKTSPSANLKDYGSVPLKFGACGSPDTDWDWVLNGKLDEIRVAKTNRNASWIKTEYNNQDSPDTFYSVAPATSLP